MYKSSYNARYRNLSLTVTRQPREFTFKLPKGPWQRDTFSQFFLFHLLKKLLRALDGNEVFSIFFLIIENLEF
jgi:hypothetical protein